jgi:hypothetical protein
MARNSSPHISNNDDLPQTWAVSLPDWLPPSMIDEVTRIRDCAIKKGNRRAFDLLVRLTSDPRMEGVWKRLKQKKRVAHKSTDEFLYPARIKIKSRADVYRARAAELRRTSGAGNENKAHLLELEATQLEGVPATEINMQWSEQDLALRILFTHAYNLALDPPPVVNVAEAHQYLTELRNISARLRNEASKLSELGMEEEALEVERIAANCEEHSYWAELDEEDPLISVVVYRDRNNNSLRGYIAYLAGTTQQIFGQPLHGTLATISNVAFQRTDITPDRIHDMLRSISPGV